LSIVSLNFFYSQVEGPAPQSPRCERDDYITLSQPPPSKILLTTLPCNFDGVCNAVTLSFLKNHRTKAMAQWGYRKSMCRASQERLGFSALRLMEIPFWHPYWPRLFLKSEPANRSYPPFYWRWHSVTRPRARSFHHISVYYLQKLSTSITLSLPILGRRPTWLSILTLQWARPAFPFPECLVDLSSRPSSFKQITFGRPVKDWREFIF